MNLQRQSRISQQKRWKIMGMVWNLIEAIQKKATLITSYSVETSFYRKYRNSSLAILNNFQTKSEAIQTSKQYEVPLMHIKIRTQREQDFIWKYILNCFQNSQILNQGFVLWVQFHDFQSERREERQVESRNQRMQSGVIQCYYNEMIYQQLQIQGLPQSEQQINEMLNRLRTQYYYLNDENIGDAPDNKNLLSSEKIEGEKQPKCEEQAQISFSNSREIVQKQKQFKFLTNEELNEKNQEKNKKKNQDRQKEEKETKIIQMERHP